MKSLKKSCLKLIALCLIFSVLFSIQLTVFAENADKMDNQKIQKLLDKYNKKFNGKMKFEVLNKNDDRAKSFISVDEKDIESTLERISNQALEMEKAQDEIQKGIANKQNRSTEIEPMTLGYHTDSIWVPATACWFNNRVDYTYLYGKPSGYPNDYDHNYFSSYDGNTLWLSGVTMGWCVQKVGNARPTIYELTGSTSYHKTWMKVDQDAYFYVGFSVPGGQAVGLTLPTRTWTADFACP